MSTHTTGEPRDGSWPGRRPGLEELGGHRLDRPESPVGLEGVDETEARRQRRVGEMRPARGAAVAVEPHGVETGAVQAGNVLELLDRPAAQVISKPLPSGGPREPFASSASAVSRYSDRVSSSPKSRCTNPAVCARYCATGRLPMPGVPIRSRLPERMPGFGRLLAIPNACRRYQHPPEKIQPIAAGPVTIVAAWQTSSPTRRGGRPPPKPPKATSTAKVVFGTLLPVGIGAVALFLIVNQKAHHSAVPTRSFAAFQSCIKAQGGDTPAARSNTRLLQQAVPTCSSHLPAGTRLPSFGPPTAQQEEEQQAFQRCMAAATANIHRGLPGPFGGGSSRNAFEKAIALCRAVSTPGRGGAAPPATTTSEPT